VAQHPTSAAQGTVSAAPPRYTEHLFVPWWLWPIGLGLAAFAAAEVYLGAPGLSTWIPYLVLLPLTALGLWAAGRIRVAVQDGEFRVDDARLPIRFVSEVGVLDATAKRAALGPESDPYAFVVQRPWVRQAVLVMLDDPADPTPYWVISARHPERVCAALLAAKAATGDCALSDAAASDAAISDLTTSISAASDVQASDVQASSVPAGNVQASNVAGSNVAGSNVAAGDAAGRGATGGAPVTEVRRAADSAAG
jgi:hypothetical protein